MPKIPKQDFVTENNIESQVNPSLPVIPLIPKLSEHKFPIFLSSVCKENEFVTRDKSQIWKMRDRIFQKNIPNIYVDEKLFKDKLEDNMSTIDRLIPRIRESKIFICILTGNRPGTQIKIENSVSASTFFEMELFQAAIGQASKRIHIFMRTDFVPSLEMTAILNLIKAVFPENKIEQLSDDLIEQKISRLVDSVSVPRFNFLKNLTSYIPNSYERIVQHLDFHRAPKMPYSEFQFLYGQKLNGGPKSVGSAINKLIKLTHGEKNVEKMLSRLWLALRELMATPYNNSIDLKVLKNWNIVLERWATASAWYGLHGHTPLGTLAALNSVSKLRQRMTRLKFTSAETNHPGGALASAKYSIGNRLRGRRRRELLMEALQDLNNSNLPDGRIDPASFLIRGSIMISLGEQNSAIREFKHALDLRKSDCKSSEQEIGQALSELGYGYLRCWKPRVAREFCEQSIPLLRKGENYGHLARGLKKLYWVYVATGCLYKAWSIREELLNLVKEKGLYDQAP